MSSELNLIAIRYVDALFALAQEQGQHDAVKSDMMKLQEIFADSAELKAFLVNPVISRAQAAAGMEAVLDAIKASALTKQFITLLARERRLPIAPVAARKYLELLAASRNELTVQVKAAQPLSKAQAADLAKALSDATGKKVTMEATEDASLIGGVQIRVGSKLLDHSVAGKLDRMRQALIRAA